MRAIAASFSAVLTASPALAVTPPQPPVSAPSVPTETAPPPASPPPFNKEYLSYFTGFFEIVIPDVRLQTPSRVDLGIDSVVLSWPVHVIGVTTQGSSRAGATLFIEPAFPTNSSAVRGLAGLRTFGVYEKFGAVVEGGGVFATDGSGGFVGAGPAFGANGMIALVARRYFVLHNERWDFTLDLTVPDVTLWAIARRGRW